MDLSPDSASFLVTRGQIYAALGRREVAIADLLLALTIDRDNQENREALQRLGMLPGTGLASREALLPACCFER